MFKPKDQVTCIDETGLTTYITLGKTYTVTYSDKYSLELEGIHANFHPSRFQLTLQPNDLVKCINNEGVEQWLTLNEIYTVNEIINNCVTIQKIPMTFGLARFQKITEEPQQNQCTCTIINLMTHGCKCGQIQREKNV